ncbi:hypothetical protein [Gaoshiqia sp. Z1-71]|uniref:hypothetical protein n=1 Tax=Gaoshiqia hydrogeniformans TaxID=3290090 RepID=UPI003BF8C999
MSYILPGETNSFSNFKRFGMFCGVNQSLHLNETNTPEVLKKAGNFPIDSNSGVPIADFCHWNNFPEQSQFESRIK